MTHSFGQANQFCLWPGIAMQMCTPGISAVRANQTDTLRQSVRGTIQNGPSCGGGDVGNSFCCTPLAYDDNQYRRAQKRIKCGHTTFREPDAEPDDAGRSASSFVLRNNKWKFLLTRTVRTNAG